MRKSERREQSTGWVVKLLDSSFHSFINPHHLNPFKIFMKYFLFIPFLFGIMLCAISFCSLSFFFSCSFFSIYFSLLLLFLYFFLFSLPHRVSEWLCKGSFLLLSSFRVYLSLGSLSLVPFVIKNQLSSLIRWYSFTNSSRFVFSSSLHESFFLSSFFRTEKEKERGRKKDSLSSP